MLKIALSLLPKIINNIFDTRKIIVIAEDKGWSISEDAKNLVKFSSEKVSTGISLTHYGLRKKVIHFLSVHTLIGRKGIKYVHPSNKIILTWYHIIDEDPYLRYVNDLKEKVEYIHTSCTSTKDKLIKAGFPAERIIIIPIAIDLEGFSISSMTIENKFKLKAQLSLPENHFIIGSFQKDGNGWGEGLEPKLIKGPDLFCHAITELAEKHPVHVVLTGPARGYVKKHLEAANVSYSHYFVKNQTDLIKYFAVLDAYLVSSRIEGGPKALHECWATNTPLVTTCTGMCKDLVINGENALMVDTEDTKAMSEALERVISNKELADNLTLNGQKCVKTLDWKLQGPKYFKLIYSELLEK